MLKGIKSETVMQVLENGIFYFDKFGKVVHLCSVDINTEAIKGHRGQRQIYFKWEGLNKKIFLTKEDAEKEASKYLEKIKELKITLKLIERVNKYVTKFNRFNNRFYFYVKDKKGKEYDIYDTIPDYCFFDKERLALVCEYEYDDDYSTHYDEREYPLKDYGKTWAFSKEEIK